MMATTVEQEEPQGTQLTGDEVTFTWRKERFKELGFSENEAAVLADSKQVSYTGGRDKNSKKLTWSAPLHWGRVKKALDNGCTHTQALQIFLS
jgi:hypothetical protein